MSKRLTKEERQKFIEEYEKDPSKPLSNPEYYVIKNKKGQYNVRHVKQKSTETSTATTPFSSSSEESEPKKEEKKEEKEPKPNAL